MSFILGLRKWLRKPVRAKKPLIRPIKTQGMHYDLKAIYDILNRDYFNDQLKLEITWFGSAQRKARRHRKLGLFCFQTSRIKIHRLLDQPHFPPYFISYVVYHEMLHSVCPPIKAKRGRYRIHHPDFKTREREFAEYGIAKCWEEENKHLFFANGNLWQDTVSGLISNIVKAKPMRSKGRSFPD